MVHIIYHISYIISYIYTYITGWWFKPLRKILVEMGPPPAAVNFGFVRLAAGRMSAFWRSGCLPEQANFPK